jgi:hypothetical protein
MSRWMIRFSLWAAGAMIYSLSMSKNAAARGAEPAKFYDNSFVKGLDDAGFLKALFGSP